MSFSRMMAERRKREERKAKGLCTTCKKTLVNEKYYTCEECRERKKLNVKKRKERRRKQNGL